MKILAATKRTQGQRKNDFFCGIEGEFVRRGTICTKDRDNPDGDCGCSRALVGLDSCKSTTTVTVIETEWTEKSLVQAIIVSDQRYGWIRAEPTEQDVDRARTEAAWIVEMAAKYKVGTVLEYRNETLLPRVDRSLS